MNGPDLPEAEAPMLTQVLVARWPTGATKSELIHGVLYFTGAFDQRDVATAERAYPGRRALVNRDGALEVHPAGQGEPHSLLDSLM
ncbi:hypothetical protein AB0I94_35750 [Streptomyces sp. NPDC050147]|uniref:hypothetical protein n=1 Tax=Streptomyces sp. NPDC050147 TaxID=3155513 RepID=UPI0034331E64